MNKNNIHDISISVVIPAYNAEEYLCRAVDSVRLQSCPVDEIIVVDDGSADQTAKVLEKYSGQVKYILQDNAGVSAARNTGIQAAKGDWIAFLDADDEWLPDRIQKQVDLLHQHSEIAWVTGNYIRCLCDENQQRPHLSTKASVHLLNGKSYFDNYFDAFRHEAGGHTDTMLIKKDVLLEAGLFQPGLNQMEDMDLWWKIALKHPAIGYVADPIAIYHLNIPGSLIQSQKDFSLCRKMIKYHLAASKDTPLASSVKTCSRAMLRGWVRSLFFNKQDQEIRKMMDEFDCLFPSYYKWAVRMFLVSPALTSKMLRAASKIVRFLKIRQQLTRKPKSLDAE